MIIAGETSGDMHAASLIQDLIKTQPKTQFQFSGLGGSHMKACGVNVINDLASHGVTGFTEVIKKYGIIKKAFYQTIEHIEKTKPDLIILIDYPGFNLRLAKKISHLPYPILYYISPQLWAWKAKRIEIIKAHIDKMAVIFPFEKSLYQKHQVPVDFVGHPLANDIMPSQDTIENFKKTIGLATIDKAIALLPGSRDNEIKRLLPVMLKAAFKLKKKHPQLRFILPVAPGMKIIDEMVDKNTKKSLNLTLCHGMAREALACAHFTIVASGTASLEAALIGTPMVIIYKTSLLTYLAARKLVKIKEISLPNIILGRHAIPELIQEDCSGNNLFLEVDKYLSSTKLQTKTQLTLAHIKHILGSNAIDCTLTQSVLNTLNRQKSNTPQQIEKKA